MSKVSVVSFYHQARRRAFSCTLGAKWPAILSPGPTPAALEQNAGLCQSSEQLSECQKQLYVSNTMYFNFFPRIKKNYSIFLLCLQWDYATINNGMHGYNKKILSYPELVKSIFLNVYNLLTWIYGLLLFILFQ